MTSPPTQLSGVSFRPPHGPAADAFPFSVPALRGLGELEIDAPVTFLVGENGSGKSTLLEALAIASRLPTVGSVGAVRDDTLRDQRRLADRLTLSWRRRTHRGFFLRAEDFFGFVKSLRESRRELERETREMSARMEGASDYARGLALGPLSGSLRDMEARYGDDLDHNSHGEGFLELFRARFVPDGLYLLDEPESALSPQSQLAFLAMMGEMLGQGAQFLVATHSPILLAAPGATILSCDHAPLRPVAYDDLDSVRLWREFLAAPERYLRHVWPGEDAPV